MKNILIILIISLFQTLVLSQEVATPTKTKDLVYLKDGSTLRGTIIEQVPNEYVKIGIVGGTVVELPMSEVKRITADKGNYTFNPDGSNSKVKGFYTGYNLQAMLGQSSESEFEQRLVVGAGIQYSLGYQFNKYASLGGGFGLQLYDKVFGDLFVQARGFLPLGKLTPTLAVDAGYGVPLILSGIGNNITQQRGGISLRPSIGLRIATRNRADILVDAGYQFQHFTSKANWGWGSIDEFDVWYKRMSFRVGWLF
jgi:hypothetical protein